MIGLSGRELAKDLAAYLPTDQWMTWVEIPLGAIEGNAARADVLAVLKSFTRARLIIYEVKVTRGDFFRDCSDGKYQRYFAHCTQLYFATPGGLVKKDEVPQDCGLIVKGDHGWHVIKGAPRHEFKPSIELLLKLLMRGYEDHLIKWRQADREALSEYKSIKDAQRLLGIKIAADLSHADEIIQSAQELVKEIGTVTGKEYPNLYHATFSLKMDIERLLNHRRYISEAVDLADLVLNLFQGTRFFANDVPERLRAIAGRLDAELHKEVVETKGG